MNYSQIVGAGMQFVGAFMPPQSSGITGMYMRELQVSAGGKTIDGSTLDVSFEVPFDDDLEADEAEIVVYNLSQDTLNNLKYNSPISITAGYKGNTGVIFSGYISKVTSERDGIDLKTTIKALDSMKLKERKIKSKSYSAGATASKILKDLVKETGLTIAVFKTKKDQSFSKAVTVEGELFQNIKTYAEMCGVSCYINKGKAYVRHIKDGDNISFELSADSGLIGSPETFEEEVKSGNEKLVTKGLKIKSLLNHKITTASIIKVSSLDYKGSYRVRGGRHYGGGSDFYTVVEAIS